MKSLIKWMVLLALLVAIVQGQDTTTECEKLPSDVSNPEIQDAISLVLRKRSIGTVILKRKYRGQVQELAYKTTTCAPSPPEKIPLPQ